MIKTGGNNIIFLHLKVFVIIVFLLGYINVFGQTTTVTLTTPGPSSWTVPANVTKITIHMWGGGGAGGGTGQNRTAGGGGAGGSYNIVSNLTVNPDDLINYIVGAGGTGTEGANGNPGSSSSITYNSTTYSASGGNAGYGGVDNSGYYGGAKLSLNNIFFGGAGSNGTVGTRSGSGGGSAGSGGDGGDGSTTGGAAGAGTYPGGAGAPGRTSAGNGIAATTVGGGGGGAYGSDGNIDFAGGAGAHGRIIIIYSTESVGGTITGGNSPVCSGSSTGTMTVSGYTGTILAWELSQNGGAWGSMGGNNSSTFSQNTWNSGTWEFRVSVQNGSLPIAYSSIRTISIDALTVGGNLGKSHSDPICIGANTPTLTLAGSTGSITRWEKRLNSGSWTNISHTATTYSETPTETGTWEYRVLVKSGVCNEAYSSSISVTVNATPSVVPNSNLEVCQNITSTTLSYSSPLGNPNNYNIVFDAAAKSAGFWDQNGSLSNPITVNIPYSVATGTYNAILRVGTNYPVCTSPDYPITITIVDEITGTPGPITGSASVTQGQAGVSYSIPAVSGATTYTWNYTGTGASFNGTGNSITIDFSGTATSGDLTVNVANSCTPGGITSNAYPITVTSLCTPPSITLGANPEVCSGITSVNLPYSATTGSPDQFSIDFDATAEVQGFTDVSNALLPVSPINISLPIAAAAGVYNALLSVRNSSDACTSIDYPITITIEAILSGTPGPITGSANVVQGQTGVNYSIPAISGATTYIWNYTGTGASINGTGNSITIDFSGTATSGNLSVNVANSCTPVGITSNAYPITVSAAPTCITSQPQSVTICAGNNTSFSITTSGTRQWQVSTNGGGSWANLSNGGIYSGVTTATLLLTNVTAAYNGYMYRCVVSGSCSDTSDEATLTVGIDKYDPILSVSEQLIDDGDYTTLSLSNTQIGIYYQLLAAGSPVGSPVAGNGGTISFEAVNPSTSTNYSVEAESVSSGCTSMIIDQLTVIVNEDGLIIELNTCAGQPGANFFINSEFENIYDNNYQTPDQSKFPGTIFGAPLGPLYTDYNYGVEPADWDPNEIVLNDGNYVIANSTAGMYRSPQQGGTDVWLLAQDQSDPGVGHIYIINAADEPGIFYTEVLTGLCDSTKYEFSADIINLYSANWVPNGNDFLDYFPTDDQGNRYNILPNIDFLINGKVAFNTGNIMNDGNWNTVGFTFRTGGLSSITLSMRNNSTGGIGNDIALDNIIVRPCGPVIELDIITNIPVCPGNPVTMDAVILASDFLSPVYQWQKSTDNGDTWTNISGATTTQYTENNPVYGHQYRYVTGETNESLLSEKCFVASDPVIILTTADILSTTNDTICGSGTATLQATANSGSTINWYSEPTGGVSLGSGTSFNTGNISVTDTFYVDATQSSCTSSPRQMVIAFVKPRPTVTSVSDGSSCGAGTVQLEASASAGIINWFTETSGGTAIGSGSPWTSPSISSTTIYYAEANNNSCISTNRTSVTAYIDAAMPVAPAVQAGSDADCEQITANWSSSANAVTYYLDVSISNTFATFVSGYENLNVGNVSTYPVTGLSAGQTYYYRVRAGNGCGTSTYSGTEQYTTLPVQPSISSQPLSQTACVDANVSFIIAADDAISYQWQFYDNDISDWVILSDNTTYSGVTTTELAISNIDITFNGNQYRCLVNGDCNNIFSNTITLTVELCGANISGRIYNDQDGMSNGKIDGTITLNSLDGNNLYVLLIDTDASPDTVYQVTTMANGLYSFTMAELGKNYSVMITTSNYSVGDQTPVFTITAQWQVIGEIINNAGNTITGNDGTIDGILSLGIVNSDIEYANFGVRKNFAPVAVNDFTTTDTGVLVTINVTTNDSDTENGLVVSSVDLDPLIAGQQTSVTNSWGLWEVNNSGVVSFTSATTVCGTASIDYTINDNFGNTSNIASIEVELNDVIAPVFSSCPNNQTVDANAASCTYAVSGTSLDAEATDNCGVNTLTYTLSGATTGSGNSLNGVSLNEGTTTVNWTATDTEGNAAYCSYDVIVNSISATITSSFDDSCPELIDTQGFKPESGSYDPGATKVTFTITRIGSIANWSFNYSIDETGNVVVRPDNPGPESPFPATSTSPINVSGDSSELVFYINNNNLGNPTTVILNVTDIQDINGCEGSPASKSITIKAMPAVGPFD